MTEQPYPIEWAGHTADRFPCQPFYASENARKKSFVLMRDVVLQNGDVIPAGFMWDGASTPLSFWKAKLLYSSLPHDYYYGRIIAGNTAMTRKEADDLFYLYARTLDRAPIRGFLAWVAVRLFGWAHCKPKEQKQ